MINKEIALSYLMNNQTIYYNILNDFYNKYIVIINELDELYNKDKNTFYKICHDIKGLSMYVGACNLFEISSFINNLYINNKKIKETIIKEFIIELKTVLKEIEEIINGRKYEI